jgi:hypothetical protein
MVRKEHGRYKVMEYGFIRILADPILKTDIIIYL